MKKSYKIALLTKEMQSLYKVDKRQALYMVLDLKFNDLPDGAYFAAMAEYGFEVDDIIECNDKAVELGFYKVDK